MTNSIDQSKENGGAPAGQTIIKGSEDQYAADSAVLSTEKGMPDGSVDGVESKPSETAAQDSVEQSKENGGC